MVSRGHPRRGKVSAKSPKQKGTHHIHRTRQKLQWCEKSNRGIGQAHLVLVSRGRWWVPSPPGLLASTDWHGARGASWNWNLFTLKFSHLLCQLIEVVPTRERNLQKSEPKPEAGLSIVGEWQFQVTHDKGLHKSSWPSTLALFLGTEVSVFTERNAALGAWNFGYSLWIGSSGSWDSNNLTENLSPAPSIA